MLCSHLFVFLCVETIIHKNMQFVTKHLFYEELFEVVNGLFQL